MGAVLLQRPVPDRLHELCAFSVDSLAVKREKPRLGSKLQALVTGAV